MKPLHVGGDVCGYFRSNKGVSCRTSSHICGSWYFSVFLLRDWSLTQIYMASLMVLVMPCASLLMMCEAIHTGKMSCSLAMLVDGGGSS